MDIADVAPFTGVLLDPDAATADALCAADTNHDGSANGLDTQGFLEIILLP